MMLSLAGIPMTLGFIGKFYLIGVTVDAKLWWLSGAIVLGSALGLYYYLRVMVTLYLREPGMQLRDAKGTGPSPPVVWWYCSPPRWWWRWVSIPSRSSAWCRASSTWCCTDFTPLKKPAQVAGFYQPNAPRRVPTSPLGSLSRTKRYLSRPSAHSPMPRYNHRPPLIFEVAAP